MIPYEIWVTTPDGQEYPLVTVFDETVLSDNDAKQAALDALQDVSEKISTPGDDTLSIKRGLVTPPPYHLRLWRRQNQLEE